MKADCDGAKFLVALIEEGEKTNARDGLGEKNDVYCKRVEIVLSEKPIIIPLRPSWERGGPICPHLKYKFSKKQSKINYVKPRIVISTPSLLRVRLCAA
jgi:hypothetical protein